METGERSQRTKRMTVGWTRLEEKFRGSSPLCFVFNSLFISYFSDLLEAWGLGNLGGFKVWLP